MNSSELPCIYAVRLINDNQEYIKEQIKQWLKKSSTKRIERIQKYYYIEDQWRSLAGEMLVRFVMNRRFNISESDLCFETDGYSKPFIPRIDIQFNISHSEDWVVAVFHTDPIGIDIEFIGKADMLVAEKMFAKDEREILFWINQEYRDKMFYLIWSAKESYVKAIGKGLTIPLSNFVVTEQLDKITHDNKNSETTQNYIRRHVKGEDDCEFEKTRWYLYNYQFDANYALTICTTASELPSQIVELDSSLLIV